MNRGLRYLSFFFDLNSFHWAVLLFAFSFDVLREILVPITLRFPGQICQIITSSDRWMLTLLGRTYFSKVRSVIASLEGYWASCFSDVLKPFVKKKVGQITLVRVWIARVQS